MSALGDHARREFEQIGVTPAVADVLVQLVEVFVNWAELPGNTVTPIKTMSLILNQRPLSPLTDNPREWVRVGDMLVVGGTMGLWQNIRDPRAHSNNAGANYWLIEPGREGQSMPLYSTQHYNG